MVRELDFRELSWETKAELYKVLDLKPDDLDWLRENGNPTVLMEFTDRRMVSRMQQKKAHVLLTCISDWQGGTPQEVVKDTTKQMFLDAQIPALADWFSLSNCSMEVARLYITWLIDFCLLHGVPCGEDMSKLCEDIPRYVWACAVNKRCCICGKSAELHHWDAVGAGRNRKEICHIGMRCLPLCRAHHTEIHRIGKETFRQGYHIEPVRIDERIAKTYKLKAKES